MSAIGADSTPEIGTPEVILAVGLAWESCWGRRGGSIPLGLLRRLPWPPAACCLSGINAGTGTSCLGRLPAACCLLGTDVGTEASCLGLPPAARLDLLPIPRAASAAEGLLVG